MLALLRHDVYHLPSYVAFASRHQEVGRPVLCVAEEDGQYFAIPLIVRDIPRSLLGVGEHLYDAISPRGYSGPLVDFHPGRGDPAFTTRAVHGLSEYLCARGVICLFSRLHPLLPVPDAPMQSLGELVEHGSSFFIDLSLSNSALDAQTRQNHRREINKASRHGYVARIDERWEKHARLVDVFGESMERVGAASHWRLSPSYFAALRESLGAHLHLCVVEVAGDVAAAALLTEVDGIVEYHLAGTADKHVMASPSKLLIDFARRWAKARGNRVFHLAGSLQPGDSLSHFKAGFSSLQSPVRSWRVITDQLAYDRVADRWHDENATAPDPTGVYFPAYRRPR